MQTKQSRLWRSFHTFNNNLFLENLKLLLAFLLNQEGFCAIFEEAWIGFHLLEISSVFFTSTNFTSSWMQNGCHFNG